MKLTKPLVVVIGTGVLVYSTLGIGLVHAKQDIPAWCSARVNGQPQVSLAEVLAKARVTLDCFPPLDLSSNEMRFCTEMDRPAWDYVQNNVLKTHLDACIDTKGEVSRVQLSGFAPDTLNEEVGPEGITQLLDQPQEFVTLVASRIPETGTTRRFVKVASKAVSENYAEARGALSEAAADGGEQGLIASGQEALNQGIPAQAKLLADESRRVGGVIQSLKDEATTDTAHAAGVIQSLTAQIRRWQLIALGEIPLAIFGAVVGIIMLWSSKGRRQTDDRRSQPVERDDKLLEEVRRTREAVSSANHQ